MVTGRKLIIFDIVCHSKNYINNKKLNYDKIKMICTHKNASI